MVISARPGRAAPSSGRGYAPSPGRPARRRWRRSGPRGDGSATTPYLRSTDGVLGLAAMTAPIPVGDEAVIAGAKRASWEPGVGFTRRTMSRTGRRPAHSGRGCRWSPPHRRRRPSSKESAPSRLGYRLGYRLDDVQALVMADGDGEAPACGRRILCYGCRSAVSAHRELPAGPSVANPPHRLPQEVGGAAGGVGAALPQPGLVAGSGGHGSSG